VIQQDGQKYKSTESAYYKVYEKDGQSNHQGVFRLKKWRNQCSANGSSLCKFYKRPAIAGKKNSEDKTNDE
jgi:hypothetical protein